MNNPTRRVHLDLLDRSYDIHIGEGSLGRLGWHCSQAGLRGKAALVSCPTVHSLYGDMAARSLEDAGFEVHRLSLPDGEAAKTLAHMGMLLEKFAASGLERTDPVIALGGGTIGDTAGFAAATYLRGVPLVHVPTTLLAQVDSAVGGKTGVNLVEGKNLAGAIWQPRLVLCDTSTLSTLPVRELASGMAEIIKYGLISKPSIVGDVSTSLHTMLGSPPVISAEIVSECVAIKAAIVAEDEREGNRRRVLNFGHTYGHALEAATDYGSLLHGEAVALGMVVAMELSVDVAGLNPDVSHSSLKLLKQIFSELSFPELKFDRLAELMAKDKKVARGKMVWVLLGAPGLPECFEIESLEVVAGACERAKAKWSTL